MLIVILYFMSEQNKSMKQLKDKTEAKHWAGSEKWAVARSHQQRGLGTDRVK